MFIVCSLLTWDLNQQILTGTNNNNKLQLYSIIIEPLKFENVVCGSLYGVPNYVLDILS